MEKKDIEKQLKQSANKIKMKDFDVRWETLKDRISDYDKNEDVGMSVSEPIPVLVAAEGRSNEKLHSRKAIFLALVLFCVLMIAIILPIVLMQNRNTFYLNTSELKKYVTDENEFMERIHGSDISIIDFSQFTDVNYILYVTSENEVRGGSIEFMSEEKEYFVHIDFYDEYVRETMQDTEDYNDFEVNDLLIRYKTSFDQEAYNTTAILQYNKVNYYIDILSAYDNISEIFVEMFVNV